jgi:hypothetical protein
MQNPSPAHAGPSVHRFTLLLAIGALFVSAVQAAPTAEQIYARYIEARGGQAKLDAIQSIIERGTYTEGTYSGSAVQAHMRPYYRLVGDPGDKIFADGAEGYDGSAWEYYPDPGIVLRVVSSAAAALRHNSYLFGLLVDYKVQGSVISFLGTANIAGREAYKLRVHLMDGFEEDEFIDAKTWLLVATRKAAKVHAFGSEVTSQTRISDYRRVEGVLFPFLYAEVDIKTGKELNRFQTTGFELNRKLEPKDFSPPNPRRTAEQSLIESLFAQRDDAQAVMWTLFDFRRVHPDARTDAAMEVAGYQILKMGQNATALALLEENARRYPQSSGAAFGLGRAYRTAGDDAKAHAEFERALQLDPNNKRAQDALQTIAQPQAKP